MWHKLTGKECHHVLETFLIPKIKDDVPEGVLSHDVFPLHYETSGRIASIILVAELYYGSLNSMT
jgi:hypothetical protein